MAATDTHPEPGTTAVVAAADAAYGASIARGEYEEGHFTKPDGTPYDDAAAARIRAYVLDLLDGRVFSYAEVSHRGVRLGGPPINRDTWARIIDTMGRMARESNALAQIAADVVYRVPLYQTEAETYASMYAAMFTAVSRGYDDVIGRAAPDAGRYSAYQRRFTLAECILVEFYATIAMSPGSVAIGWCLDAVARAIVEANVGLLGQRHMWPGYELAVAGA